VANAIDEIIHSLKGVHPEVVKEKIKQKELLYEPRHEEERREQERPIKLIRRKKLTSTIAAVVLLVMAAIIVYPKIFQRNTLERLRSSGERISVAVMPFQNLTNDTIWNVWQDIIQDNLINYLSNFSKELRVWQVESINNLIQKNGLVKGGSITVNIAKTISKKLDADVFIYGSIIEAGIAIRLNAQIIDPKNEEALKTFEIKGRSSKEVMFHIVDSLRKEIMNYLVISKLEMEGPIDFKIKYFEYASSPEAYRYFIYGQNSFWSKNYPIAKDWYLKAVQVDSNFFNANVMLSYAFEFTGSMEQAKQLSRKLYLKRDQMTTAQQIVADHLYAHYFGTPQDRIIYAKKYETLDDQSPINYYVIASNYNSLYQFDKAIPEFEKALKIYDKLGTDPSAIWCYVELGYAYHKTGQFKKEKKLYKKAEQDFPDDPDLIYRQAILSLTEGDDKDAIRYIEKYRYIRKENSWSETDITTSLADIYSEAGMLEKAEQYYRHALSSVELTSDNSW
jgi:tetratricopeptide (TPR) repeat protein